MSDMAKTAGAPRPIDQKDPDKEIPNLLRRLKNTIRENVELNLAVNERLQPYMVAAPVPDQKKNEGACTEIGARLMEEIDILSYQNLLLQHTLANLQI